MADVKPIPDGYPRVIPSLIIDGAAAAIEFYGSVLGASVRLRMDSPDGKVGHAELQLGDSVIMLADEFPDMGFLGPKSVGGTPVTLLVYVDEVDAVFQHALSAGATELRGGREPVLRGPVRAIRGSLRTPMERGHPRRGRARRRDDAARRGGHGSGVTSQVRCGTLSPGRIRCPTGGSSGA